MSLAPERVPLRLGQGPCKKKKKKLVAFVVAAIVN